jgi:hypothetical protein
MVVKLPGSPILVPNFPVLRQNTPISVATEKCDRKLLAACMGETSRAEFHARAGMLASIIFWPPFPMVGSSRRRGECAIGRWLHTDPVNPDFQFRIILGIFSGTVSWMCGTFVWIRIQAPAPTEEVEWTVRLLDLIFWETLTTIGVLSLLAFLWSLCRPVWLENLLRKMLRHYVVIILVFGVAVAVTSWFSAQK